MKKLLAIAVFLSGCSTTTANLTSRTDNMQTWEVAAPIETVFRKYKIDVEDEAGEMIFGGGIRPSGYFYGNSAELTLKVESLHQATCLYVQLDKSDNGTLVKAWHYSNHWKELADKLRKSLPTK